MIKNIYLFLRLIKKTQISMKKQLFYLAVLFFAFTSCDIKEPDGKARDSIKFSTTELTLDARESTEIVTSKGHTWWILEHISINNNSYYLSPDSPDSIIVKAEPGRIFNPSSNEIYDEGTDQKIKKIIGEWFTIERERTNKVVIHVTKNDSGKERNFRMGAQDANYFSGIKVVQKKN